MSEPLRRQLIRLAHARPDLRPHILPLISHSGGVRTAASYEDYVDRKRKDGEEPLSKDDWESRVKSKDKGDKDKGDKDKGDKDKGGVDKNHPGMNPDNPNAFGRRNPTYNPKGAKAIRSAVKYFGRIDDSLERLERQGERSQSYKGDPKVGVSAHRKVQEILEQSIAHAAEIGENLKGADKYTKKYDDERGALDKALDKARGLWDRAKGLDDKARARDSATFARQVADALRPISGLVYGLESLATDMDTEDAGEAWYGVPSPVKGKKKAAESDAAAGSDGYYMTAQYLRQIADQSRELADAVQPGMPLPDWFEAKVAQAAGTVRDLHGYMKYKGK